MNARKNSVHGAATLSGAAARARGRRRGGPPRAEDHFRNLVAAYYPDKLLARVDAVKPVHAQTSSNSSELELKRVGHVTRRAVDRSSGPTNGGSAVLRVSSPRTVWSNNRRDKPLSIAVVWGQRVTKPGGGLWRGRAK